MSKKVFIAYDFNIKTGLPDRLSWVKEKAGPEFTVEYPDPFDGRSQGEIWRDIVRPKIEAADRVIAYVDLPNANVGFEVGYALGAGRQKEVALARVRETLPEWLKQPPFATFGCPMIFHASKLLDLVKGDDWVKAPGQPDRGSDALLLCPPIGGVYSDALTKKFARWRTLPPAGWTVNDLPERLSGVGAIVWLIVPHAQGESERDGQENAAASVVAGFAAGLGLPIHVLIHKDSRVVVDVAGQALGFANTDQLLNLFERVMPDLERELAPPKALSGVIKSEPQRPELPPLPQLDELDSVEELFIGRERLLADFSDALRGLDARFRGEALSGAAAVHAAWYDGFGGMGKSWFLRKAKLETERRLLPHAKVALIDWDVQALLRSGLLMPPTEPRDLFSAVARRLGQLYGVTALDPCWAAEARVDRSAADHQDLIQHFQRGLTGWTEGRTGTLGRDATPSNQPKDEILKSVLLTEGLWDEDPSNLRRNIDAARRDPTWEPRLQQQWFTRGGGPKVQDLDAARKPDQLLLSALQSAIRSVTRIAPLILIFDTCEVLSEEMDRWMRRMVVPLCDSTCAVLFLFGSRLPPDIAERPGINRGWRAEVGDKLWRRVRFDRDVHFTLEEVRQALRKLKRGVENEREIASKLHEVTRGVPLALRTLLDLHENGDDVLLHLSGIGESMGSEEQGERAINVVIEATTNRFLLHLENNPGRAGDMEDIVALALLPRADNQLLSHHWGKGAVKPRLLELTRRYALLTEGDLHETVRSFLRQRWRGEERPTCFADVLGRLGAVAASPTKARPGDPDYFDAAVMRLNFLGWSEGENSLPKFAPVLALALAFNADPTVLVNLAVEIGQSPMDGNPVQGTLKRLLARRHVSSMLEPWGTDDMLAWLEREARRGGWEPVERGSLALLLGLKQARGDDGDEALKNLKEADELLGQRLPRKSEAGEAARAIGAKFLKGRKWLHAEAAFTLQIALGYSIDTATNDMGVAKWNRRQAGEAERLFRCAAELEPREPLYIRNLAAVLEQGRHWEEARAAYDHALALQPDYAPAINGLALLHRRRTPPDLAEAERLFRRAAELEPTDPLYPRNLGDLLQERRRWKEARVAYDQALALQPDYAPAIAGLALLHRRRTPPDLAEAERLSRRAAEVEPTDPLYPRNLGDLLRQAWRWEEARVAYEQALALSPDDDGALNGLALLHRERRPSPDLAEAERLFRRAAEVDPRDPLYPRNLGDLLREGRRWDEARVAYDQALALQPNNAPAINSLALLHKGHSPSPDLAEAERLFRRAAEVDPTEPIYLCNLGDLLREGRRWEEARVAYDQALAVQPDYAPAINDLAVLHKGCPSPDLAEAERLFGRAAEIDPKNPLYPRNLGDLLREGRRWDEARVAYDQALALQSDYAPAINGLALLHKGRRPSPDLAEAERLFRRAAEIDPKNPLYPRNLGDLLREGRRWEEARVAYDQALALQSDYAPAINGLALLHKGRRPSPDLAEAERLFRLAAEVESSEPLYLCNLGDLLREGRRWEEARVAYDQALALQSDYAPAINGLALLHKGRRPSPDLAEAERLFRLAAEVESSEPLYPCNLGDLLREGRRWEEARVAYDRALALQSDYAAAIAGLALLHFRRPSPDLAEAERLLRRAAELEPEEQGHGRNLADLLFELNRAFEAEEVLKRTIDADPVSAAPTCNHLAWVLYVRGERLQEALDLAEKAIRLDPNMPEVRHTYADICLRLNRPDGLTAVENWIGCCFPEFLDEYRDDALATFRTLRERHQGLRLLELLKLHRHASVWVSWIAALEAAVKRETPFSLDDKAQSLFESLTAVSGATAPPARSTVKENP